MLVFVKLFNKGRASDVSSVVAVARSSRRRNVLAPGGADDDEELGADEDAGSDASIPSEARSIRRLSEPPRVVELH